MDSSGGLNGQDLDIAHARRGVSAAGCRRGSARVTGDAVWADFALMLKPWRQAPALTTAGCLAAGRLRGLIFRCGRTSRAQRHMAF